MTINLRRRGNTQKRDLNAIYQDFSNGTNTLLPEAALGPKMARRSTNLMQTGDNKWTTRWGTAYYGMATPNSAAIDGFAEYVKSDETTELIVVATNVYKSTDGGSWTQITGATFTAGNICYFQQIGSRLYITNGVDDLAYYDGSNLNVFSSLSAPAWAGTPLARTTLTAGNYSNYYQVTALNSVGETVGSTEQTITTNKHRDAWTGGEKITVDWTAVGGASRYQIYWSEESGDEVLLGSTTDTVFDDDASLTPNPYREVPNANTTAAPKFKQMELSGNRLWATQDPNNRYRVYFSGTGQYMGYFSAFYGGGYIDIEKGGRNLPRAVTHYRTGKGDSIVTVLCSSPEGQGSIWQVDIATATVEDTTFTIPSAVKIIGSVGTDAPLSVVKTGNSIKFFNRRGFFTLGNKPNLLNILDTQEDSLSIRPDVRSLYASKISGVAGYYYDGKVFYSVPNSSTGNDRTWVFDTERNNWQLDAFTTGFRSFGEYTDSSKVTHFLGVAVSGTKLIEISENVAGDLGVAFSQTLLTGLYSIDPKDKTVFAKINKAYVELENPRGTISFTLLGTEKGQQYSSLGTVTISSTTSQTGFSWDRYSNNKFSSSSGTPTTFSSSSLRRSIRVRKLLNNYQFKLSTSGVNDGFTLLSFQVKGKIVNTRDPSSWST